MTEYKGLKCEQVGCVRLHNDQHYYVLKFKRMTHIDYRCLCKEHASDYQSLEVAEVTEISEDEYKTAKLLES